MAQAKTLYTINVFRARKYPRNRRAGKAVQLVKDFVRRHNPDATAITLSPSINSYFWSNGARNPPHTIKVQVVERDEGELFVEHADRDIEKKTEKKAEPQFEAKKGKKDALPDAVEEAIKEGTVAEAKEALTGLNRQQFKIALDVEKEHKNRKTLVRFIESNM